MMRAALAAACFLFVPGATQARDLDTSAAQFAACAGLFEALALASLHNGAATGSPQDDADTAFRFYRAALVWAGDHRVDALFVRVERLNQVVAAIADGRDDELEPDLVACEEKRDFLAGRGDW